MTTEECDRIDVDFNALTRIAAGVLRGLAPAEDAVGQGLLRKIEGSPKSPESLVYAAARSLRRDTIRQLQRETLVGLADDVDALLHEESRVYAPSKAPQATLRPETSMSDLEEAEFRADFDLALRRLPAAERDALILTELRGLTVREAADVLDVHYATVSRRRQAALDFIREEIA